MKARSSTVYFASAIPAKLERELTLPAKFLRLLDCLPIHSQVKGRTVAIKMHVGGGIGYSTIHPLFVKLLVDHVRKGQARRVFVTDANISGAAMRGYAKQTIGADIRSDLGRDGKSVVTQATRWKHLPRVELSKPVLDADVLINFSHVKGHGACGFGGACKNLAMGCVPTKTRAALHSLEGNLQWNRKKCIRCKKCIRACSMNANTLNAAGGYEIFWHHCKMCMHCMLACPTRAIRIQNRNFSRFQEGLARVTKLILDHFDPADVFHLNVLTNITIFCDCWGFTTPALVPDIGVYGSQDIVAVEHASLMSIKLANLIPGALTPPYVLGKRGHLFERIHHKDPFEQVQALARLGAGSLQYKSVTV